MTTQNDSKITDVKNIENFSDKEKVINLLRKMKMPEELNDLLGKDALLSESFTWYILSASAETAWIPRHLNIFCSKISLTRIRKFLKNKKFKYEGVFFRKYTETENTLVEQWSMGELFSDPPEPIFDEKEAREFFAKTCEEYDLPYPPFDAVLGTHIPKNPETQRYTTENSQLIQLRIDPTEPYFNNASLQIVNKFALPTLENWWDGKTMHVSYPEQVVARESRMRPIVFAAANAMKRICERYTNYGLKILE